MAFVSEKITTEEDKNYFESVGFTNMVNKPLKPDWWAIDKERNIILTSRGGIIGESSMGYQLYINGFFVNMIADYWTEGSRFNNNLKVKWRVEEIQIPQEILEDGYKLRGVKDIIREAFIGWAMPGVSKSQLLEVTVEFNDEQQKNNV